jgi:replicative DNA helicase
LRRADLLDAIGGPATLITLQANTPATTNAGRYARIVEEHALLRRLIGVAGEIAEMSYGVPEDVAEAVDRAETLVFEVAERRVTDSLRPLHDLLSESLDRLEALYDRGESITGVPTGFLDLDDRLSGLQPSSLVIVGARPSMGKALSLDTPLPTPAGWTTMGEVRVGDSLLDARGHRCSVTYQTPVMFGRTCYRVTFDDGSTIVADADHQWFAHDLSGDQRSPWREARVVTTQQMVDEGVRTGPDQRANWYVPLTRPLDLPHQELPLDPYLLGLWLGDGSSATSMAFRPLGDRVQPASPSGGPITYRISHGHPTLAAVSAGAPPRRHLEAPPPSLISGVGGLGGPTTEHIPTPYLRASDEQRRALLQGLMDTQGTVTDAFGTVELCLSNLALLSEARELACSLGHKVGAIGRRSITISGRRCLVWRFAWTPVDDVFRRAPKADRLAATRSHPRPGRHARRAIVSIVPCPSVPVRCITVDSPDHLYLAGDSMIPTHNTAMALGMAAHAAMTAHVPVLFFSLEMSHSEVTQRLLCSEARVNSTRIRNGKLHESDWPKISHAIGRLGEAPLYIDDNPNLTVMEIRAKARRLRSRLGALGLIVVDYLQLMSGRHSAENRQVEVSEISRGLKILARELEVPVVALSQLSRNLELRADKRPVLADLRESGSLEQDADVVMFLYRDEVYNSESPDRGSAEVIISKHRNGPTGITHLAFLSDYTRFDNMARV